MQTVTVVEPPDAAVEAEGVEIATVEVRQMQHLCGLYNYLREQYPGFKFQMIARLNHPLGVAIAHAITVAGVNSGPVFNQLSAECRGYMRGFRDATPKR